MTAFRRTRSLYGSQIGTPGRPLSMRGDIASFLGVASRATWLGTKMRVFGLSIGVRDGGGEYCERLSGVLEILCQSTNLTMRGLTHERRVRF